MLRPHEGNYVFSDKKSNMLLFSIYLNALNRSNNRALTCLPVSELHHCLLLQGGRSNGRLYSGRSILNVVLVFQQCPEVRLPLGQGIAGHVASTGIY